MNEQIQEGSCDFLQWQKSALGQNYIRIVFYLCGLWVSFSFKAVRVLEHCALRSYFLDPPKKAGR